MKVLAFDVGGTHLRGAFASATGELGPLDSNARVATPREDPDALCAAIARLARQIDPGSEAGALGLAMAGVLDVPRGTIVHSPSLGLREVELGARLEEALERPVVLVNDVNAAALGEARAAACEDLAAIFVGTGVGTGFVSGGRLMEGGRGMAGEGGHVVFRPGGLPGPAGVDGCFESYLGGRCLGERAVQAGVGASAKELLAAWRAGDPVAAPLVEDALEAMRALVQLVVTLFDPSRIVLGGGVLTGLPELMDAARCAIEDHPLRQGSGRPALSAALLGDAAGLHGAAARACAELP